MIVYEYIVELERDGEIHRGSVRRCRPGAANIRQQQVSSLLTTSTRVDVVNFILPELLRAFLFVIAPTSVLYPKTHTHENPTYLKQYQLLLSAPMAFGDLS